MIDDLYNRFNRVDPFDESQYCDRCLRLVKQAEASDGLIEPILCLACKSKLEAWVKFTLPLVNGKIN